MPDGALRARASALNTYLLAEQQFLRLLALLIYWTSGLPPRRKELVGLMWCNQESPRNLFLSHGLMVMVTGYHKSEWRVGTPCVRPIRRRFICRTMLHLIGPN